MTPTPPADERLVLALPEDEPLPVVWHAPFFEYTGYADEARAFARAVSERWPLNAHPFDRGDVRFLSTLAPEERRRMEALVGAPESEHFVNVVHAPGHAAARVSVGRYHVSRTMFETDGLPRNWVERLNEMDEVWVPSAFNCETFRSAGVRIPIHVVPGGVDAGTYRPGLDPLPVDGLSGTVFLAIFEWSFRKGWDVLLQAWARAFGPDDDVTLLVRSHPLAAPGAASSQDEIERRLNTYLKRIGTSRRRVAPIVMLRERVPEGDMPRLYATAGAYVCPSRGEGWGRPYLEAMASGLPTIATRWSGNLEFMNDANSLLVDVEGLEAVDNREELAFYRGQRWARPSVASLVGHLRWVAGNREEARALGRAARRDAEERWTWDAAAETVVERLAEIRSGLCRARRNLAAPAVRWVGAQYSYHSLAHVNREICRRLAGSGAVDLEVLTRERDDRRVVRGPEVARLEERTGPVLGRPPSVEVRHQWPPDWTPPDHGAWVAMQPWEFGGLPDPWLGPLRHEVDEVWCYTDYVRECYEASGVPPGILRVIPLGVDAERFCPEGGLYPLRTRKRTKLLFVGGTIPRKGIDVLIHAYVKTFGPDDDVCLVVKSFGSSTVYRGDSNDRLLRDLAADPHAPEIELVGAEAGDELDPDDMAALYRACHALVHPYRGEGFGLPIAEAMASGLPVVVTGHGACLDYCDDRNAWLIPATVVPVTVSEPSSAGNWLAEPDVPALCDALRTIHEDPSAARAKGAAGRARAVSELSWDRTARLVEKRIRDLATRRPRRLGGDRAADLTGTTDLPGAADPVIACEGTGTAVASAGTAAAQAELIPLNADGRFTFLYEPDWFAPEVERVVRSYVMAFQPEDRTTLVLPVLAEGPASVEIAAERITSALAAAAADPDETADVLLVPGIASAALPILRAQVDAVVLPALAPAAISVADLTTSAWREALRTRPPRRGATRAH